MIEARELTKRYGDTTAVHSLSFTIAPGTVTGFLGPNGAGKSTTMRMIMGLDRPTSGTVTVNGKPYRQHRAPLREVGALLEASAVHPGRSARSHLRSMAATHNIKASRVSEVIEMTGLAGVATKRVGGFSLGMGQRLGIAAALLGDPRTLILDEPVNGLDPEGVQWVRQLVRALAAEGRTVFLSSHLMSEMSQTADHLLVIGRGRIIAAGPVQQVIDSVAGGAVRVRSPRAGELAAALAADGATVTSPEAGMLEVSGTTAEHVGEVAFRNGLLLHELSPRRASLEEAYMSLTQDAVEYRAHTTPTTSRNVTLPDKEGQTMAGSKTDSAKGTLPPRRADSDQDAGAASRRAPRGRRRTTVPATMRAVIQDGYGAPERVLRLEEIPVPSIGADDVLIRMRATSVNTPDWATVTGVPYILRLGSGLRRPKRPVRGSDVAGVVEAVGQRVTDLAAGDEVLGSTRAQAGAFAQYVAAPAAQLVRKPARLTFTDAAASVMTGLAALVAMRDVAQAGAGTRVLINGASGGVGTMAVQIAKVLGAEVTGVCGTRNVELVRSLGADHVIDHTKEDFTQSRPRFDVILDNVLNHPPKATARVLAPNGVLIPNSIGYTGGLLAGLPRTARAVLMGFGSTNVRLVSPAVNRENLDALLRLLEPGEVRVVIDKSYPLDQAASAVTHMLEHHATGKIAITA